MSGLLLRVTDLHAGYGRAEVLHGLNLQAAAGSVVTRDIPAGVFAAGNPCRVVRPLPG